MLVKDKTIILFNMRNGSHYTIYNQPVTIAYNQTTLDLQIADKPAQFEAGDLCYLRIFNQQTIPCWYSSNDNNTYKFKTIYDLFNEENTWGFDYTKLKPFDALLTYLKNNCESITTPVLKFKLKDSIVDTPINLPSIDSDNVKDYFLKVVKQVPVTFDFDPNNLEVQINFGKFPYFAKNIVVLNGTNNNLVDLYKSFNYNGSILFNDKEKQNKLYISKHNQITTDWRAGIDGTLKNVTHSNTAGSFASQKSDVVASLSSSNSSEKASLSAISSAVVRPYEIYGSLVSENSSYQSSLASASNHSTSAKSSQAVFIKQTSDEKKKYLADMIGNIELLSERLNPYNISNNQQLRYYTEVASQIRFNLAQLDKNSGYDSNIHPNIEKCSKVATASIMRINNAINLNRIGKNGNDIASSAVKDLTTNVSILYNALMPYLNTLQNDSGQATATYSTTNPVFESLVSNNNSYVAQFNVASSHAIQLISAATANQSIANSYSAQASSAISQGVQFRLQAVNVSSSAYDQIKVNNNSAYSSQIQEYNSLLNKAYSYSNLFNDNYSHQKFYEGAASAQLSQANSYNNTALSNSYAASLTANYITNFDNLNLNYNPYYSSYSSYTSAVEYNSLNATAIQGLSSDTRNINDVELIDENVNYLLNQLSNVSFTVKTSSIKDIEGRVGSTTFTNGNYEITDRLNVYVPNMGITFTSIITAIKYISSTEAELSCGFLYDDLKGFIRKIAKGDL